MEGEYYWQKINYFTDNPVPRVVRWHLETRQKEGSIRNLSFTPKANKTWVTYEWRRMTAEHVANLDGDK